MHDPCITAFAGPIDEIRITADREDAGVLLAGDMARIRKLTNQVCGLAYSGRDIARALRADLVEIR